MRAQWALKSEDDEQAQQQKGKIESLAAQVPNRMQRNTQVRMALEVLLALARVCLLIGASVVVGSLLVTRKQATTRP